MMVRAKFYCEEKKESGEGFDIRLRGVYGGSPENDKFFKYTPAANCSLMTVNPDAALQFVEGKEYYVDFSLAE